MTLAEQVLGLSAAERDRFERVMERLAERDFEPFPAGEAGPRRRAVEEAWASGAVEGVTPSPLSRVLTLQLLVRRVPEDLAVELMLADVVEHAPAAPAVAGEAA